MSNIINFNFETHQVRTATNGDDVYFCLADVASILEIQNHKQMVQKQLDPKGVIKIDTTDSLKRKQSVTFINEPNLYRVIFRSNKKEAVKFQNWVFDEVLPTIRKTGSYRHTISAEQQAQIRQTVAKRCKSNREHYQSIYTALHQKFGIPRYDELLACDFDEALVFITDFQLADDVGEYNSLWKLIGILEYERIDREIRELKRTIDTAYQQIERISRTKGLIYDAISEQKTNCPYNANRLNEARAFIAKQMAMKQRFI